jgi:hypothetical protein
LDNPTLDNRTAKENNLIKNKNKEDKDINNSFNEFWLLYPRKVGKADAVKAWNKAIKLETPKRLLELTKAYSEGKLPEMTYIPYPASWLNKGLYESIELAEAKPLPKLFVGRIK